MCHGIFSVMATITLADFNRDPSSAAHLARSGMVTITDDGIPTLELRAFLPGSVTRLEELRRAGMVRRAPNRSASPAPDFGVTSVIAREIISDFETNRANDF